MVYFITRKNKESKFYYIKYEYMRINIIGIRVACIIVYRHVRVYNVGPRLIKAQT